MDQWYIVCWIHKRSLSFSNPMTRKRCEIWDRFAYWYPFMGILIRVLLLFWFIYFKKYILNLFILNPLRNKYCRSYNWIFTYIYMEFIIIRIDYSRENISMINLLLRYGIMLIIIFIIYDTRRVENLWSCSLSMDTLRHVLSEDQEQKPTLTLMRRNRFLAWRKLFFIINLSIYSYFAPHSYYKYISDIIENKIVINEIG